MMFYLVQRFKDRDRGKQYMKYKSLNIPIVYCNGHSDIRHVKDFIEDNLYNLDYLGRPIIINAV